LLIALDNDLGKKINWESDIDLRDHFKWDTLRSKYIVIGYPIQMQFPKKYQRVIYLPANDIITHTGIGNDYTKIGPSFNLANNITARIYERKKQLSNNDIARFARQLYRFYPSWKDYDNKRISMEFVSAKVVLGKKWGYVGIIGNNEIFMSPGVNSKTSIAFNVTGGYKPTKIIIGIPSYAKLHCPDTHGVLANVSVNNRTITNDLVTPGVNTVSIMPKNYSSFKIGVKPIINPDCDWVHIKFSGK
jgi:hypothetical protein